MIHQFSSVAQLCLTLHNHMDCSIPGFAVLHHLPEFAQTHVHWVSDVIQTSHPCRPILLLPSIFPSIRIFSNESALCIRWPKYWTFSFSISPSNEYSGLISFRIDWFDLLAVQGTLKNLLQHHSSKPFQNKTAHFQMQSLSSNLGHIKAATRKQWVLMKCTRVRFFDSLGFAQGLQDSTQFMGFRQGSKWISPGTFHMVWALTRDWVVYRSSRRISVLESCREL